MRWSALSHLWGWNRILVVSIALLALELAGCAQTDPNVMSSTPTPTLAPLPTLQPPRGFVTALVLSNANGGSRAGSFIASKPYNIMFVCEGKGNFYLTYDTASGPVKQEMSCLAAPQLNGTQLWPATGGEVTVSASADLGVPWEVLVEMPS